MDPFNNVVLNNLSIKLEELNLTASDAVLLLLSRLSVNELIQTSKTISVLKLVEDNEIFPIPKNRGRSPTRLYFPGEHNRDQSPIRNHVPEINIFDKPLSQINDPDTDDNDDYENRPPSTHITNFEELDKELDEYMNNVKV